MKIYLRTESGTQWRLTAQLDGLSGAGRSCHGGSVVWRSRSLVRASVARRVRELRFAKEAPATPQKLPANLEPVHALADRCFLQRGVRAAMRPGRRPASLPRFRGQR
ncbi:hypothetical protein Stsp01_49090 [Streptomyces sp. NBRC 13847]|nr:hypothetical protein Stsp01_49090 [Streptomyces sp. NBRC 13847]